MSNEPKPIWLEEPVPPPHPFPARDAAGNPFVVESTPMGPRTMHGLNWTDSPSIITIPAHGFNVLKVAMRTTRVDDGFDLVWIWNVTSFDQFDAIRRAMESGDIGALRAVAAENPAIDWRAVSNDHAHWTWGGSPSHPDALAYIQQLAEVQP